MSRRREAEKRQVIPDPVYKSELLSRFINTVMQSGKKSVAESIVYGALDTLNQKLGSKVSNYVRNKEESESDATSGVTSAQNAILTVFDRALDNVRPTVEVRARRVGGSTYQIPVEVRASRRTTLAMRWVIESAASRGEKTMALRLAAELMDALEGRGAAVKKRETAHSMAKANQAFAHFRWN